MLAHAHVHRTRKRTPTRTCCRVELGRADEAVPVRIEGEEQLLHCAIIGRVGSATLPLVVDGSQLRVVQEAVGVEVVHLRQMGQGTWTIGPRERGGEEGRGGFARTPGIAYGLERVSTGLRGGSWWSRFGEEGVGIPTAKKLSRVYSPSDMPWCCMSLEAGKFSCQAAMSCIAAAVAEQHSKNLSSTG